MESSLRRSLIPMSPSHTPRSREKIAQDARSNDSNSSNNDKEKGVKIQVVLRCRPLNGEEKRVNTPVVITCNEQRREVSVSQNIASKQIDRTFVFDKVFDTKSKQKDVFDQAVVPLVKEVLEGYNCTIFAYGQTGTGKTYTMEGGGTKMQNSELPSDAGVIPRAVRKIFDVLESQGAEYSMKVSFLELYNEELTDLLAPDETKLVSDEKTKKPIALMEDGKGGVIVRGLEEEMVHTAGEIYKILEKGSAKRKTAETLLNKQSSRSHSIFSITTHIKECTPEGDELIKSGKLNLVDLAGSENISRSGAREGRAREAGEINKSLLTLGRVINTLVEHSGHIPYRDSKLTRLLRDSLGGRTKTCIIATVAPTIHCLEETLSTLDYAHRAKNIKNRPEVNQKMMKTALIKDLYSDIERLKQELYAAREKNGVYIPQDQYLNEEAQKKAMSEKLDRLEIDLESKDKKLIEVQELYDMEKALSGELTENLQKSQKKLEQTELALSDLEQRYNKANCTIKEEEFLISNLVKSEKALFERASGLRSELENTIQDVSGLFSKIERKDKMEGTNKTLVQNFRSQLTLDLDQLQKIVLSSVSEQENRLLELGEEIQSFISTKTKVAEGLKERVGDLKEKYGSSIRELDGFAAQIDSKSQSTFEKLNSQVNSHASDLENCLKGILVKADELLNELNDGLTVQQEKLSSFVQKQLEAILRTVETTRSISTVTEEFFSKLDGQASKLCLILEESQNVNHSQISQLEKKFQECAAKEERYLIEKVSELLAASNAKKNQLVQESIRSLRETGSKNTGDLQTELITTQNLNSSIREKWRAYMQNTEDSFLKDSSEVESGKCSLVEGLQNCTTKVKPCWEQWSNAEISLLNIGKSHVASTETTIKEGREGSQLIRERLSSAVSNAMNGFDLANKDLISSINDSLGLDKELHETMESMVGPYNESLRELQIAHNHKVAQISDSAETSLEKDYQVDEVTCSTPRKRAIELPTVRSIEELKTPAFEELLKLFWEEKVLAKQLSGDAKHLFGSIESQAQRHPFSTIN